MNTATRIDGRAPYQLHGTITELEADLNEVVAAVEALPKSPRPLMGEDPAGDNANRASYALEAIKAYAKETRGTGEPFFTIVGDLMNDLRHLLDVFTDDAGESLDSLAERSLHYDAEIHGLL